MTLPVQLIALDLDGTIFGDDLTISPRTRNAIRAAQEKGVIVTIATGRMYHAAQKIAAELSITGPIICYQGALIQDAGDRAVLYHQTVPLPLAHRIVDATQERGLHLNAYMYDKLFVGQVTPEARFYSRINMELPLNMVGDLHAWLDSQQGNEPTKLVIVTEPEQTDATLAEFTDLFASELQVIKSHPRFTEFTNIECSKGRALAFLASFYNVPQANVMAIGDGHNDMDMIAWAGYGVAMCTAPQNLQDLARIVCPSLLDDGAADTIERYVLNPS
jgi:Cof subfamily protein (haloacid dehalogenase superfamily)